MYTIKKISDYKFHLFYDDKYKGCLFMFKEQADLIVKCLNDCPSLDDE